MLALQISDYVTQDMLPNLPEPQEQRQSEVGQSAFSLQQKPNFSQAVLCG